MINDTLKVKAYLYVMIAISASIHMLIGIYFAYLGIYALVVLSVIDVIVYIIAFFVNKSGKVRLASFITTFKIITYSLVATFLFGINVNAQWLALVAILPAALHLDFTKKQRVCIVGCIPILINLQLLLPKIHPPPFSMDDNVFLAFFFVNVVVLGFILSIVIDTIITKRIADSYAKEIDNFKHISNVDPLTALNNRRYAEHFFETIINDEQHIPFLFCLIDIDNFKAVNDTYGHDIGDIVLSSIADILRQNARKTDLVCRWGGEEFLIGFSKCSAERGREILEKIRKIIEDEIIFTESGEIKVTVTGGAMILTDNDIKAALVDCDKKLYEGKRSGKNKIVM